MFAADLPKEKQNNKTFQLLIYKSTERDQFHYICLETCHSFDRYPQRSFCQEALLCVWAFIFL